MTRSLQVLCGTSLEVASFGMQLSSGAAQAGEGHELAEFRVSQMVLGGGGGGTGGAARQPYLPFEAKLGQDSGQSGLRDAEQAAARRLKALGSHCFNADGTPQGVHQSKLGGRSNARAIVDDSGPSVLQRRRHFS